MDDVKVVPSNTLLSDDDRAKLASLQQKQSPLRDVSFFVDGNRAAISANGAVRARVWVLAPGDCSRGIRAMESHGIGAVLHTMQHPPQTVQASCATKTAPLRRWASQIGRTPPGTKALQGTGHRAGGHGIHFPPDLGPVPLEPLQGLDDACSWVAEQRSVEGSGAHGGHGVLLLSMPDDDGVGIGTGAASDGAGYEGTKGDPMLITLLAACAIHSTATVTVVASGDKGGEGANGSGGSEGGEHAYRSAYRGALERALAAFPNLDGGLPLPVALQRLLAAYARYCFSLGRAPTARAAAPAPGVPPPSPELEQAKLSVSSVDSVSGVGTSPGTAEVAARAVTKWGQEASASLESWTGRVRQGTSHAWSRTAPKLREWAVRASVATQEAATSTASAAHLASRTQAKAQADPGRGLNGNVIHVKIEALGGGPLGFTLETRTDPRPPSAGDGAVAGATRVGTSAFIAAISPGGAAEAAGMLVGDEILAVGAKANEDVAVLDEGQSLRDLPHEAAIELITKQVAQGGPLRLTLRRKTAMAMQQAMRSAAQSVERSAKALASAVDAAVASVTVSAADARRAIVAKAQQLHEAAPRQDTAHQPQEQQQQPQQREQQPQQR